MTTHRWIAILLFVLAAGVRGGDLRVGIIGTDTSHAPSFVKLLNSPAVKGHVPGTRVVAGFKGGSPDVEPSRTRVDAFAEQIRTEFGVVFYDSIEEMCRHVDGVLLTSIDGRVHLAQARPVIAARKPLFIDKPMAASVKDAQEIFRLAREAGTPVFSCSMLRFGANAQAVRNGSIGRVTRAVTHGPVMREPNHPELFWYGIHGIETLFTVMGDGCETVRRGVTPETKVEVEGTWPGGRIGIFREAAYGGAASGEQGESPVGENPGHPPLLTEVVKFFRTGVSPVPEQETIELLAFMEAADESLRQGGRPVAMSDILNRAGADPAP